MSDDNKCSPTEKAEMSARLTAQKQRILESARLAGRAASQVKLLAVSKKMPASRVEAAYELGQRDFGENYAQELAQKAEALAHLREIRWHMIGHLQSNKAKLLVPFVANVSSVDSIKLAEELSKQAVKVRPAERGDLEVLIEVNIGGEVQKSGVEPHAVPELVQAIGELERLKLKGFLCIPPETPDPEGARPYFRKLRELREAWGGSTEFPELSMGMSRDLEVAVSEGATWVRIGTAIFGERRA